MADVRPRIPPDQRDRALINEASALLAADLEPARLFESLCEMLARFVDAAVIFIALHDGNELRMAYFHDHGELRRAPNLVLDRRGRSWRTLRTGRPMLFRDLHDLADTQYDRTLSTLLELSRDDLDFRKFAIEDLPRTSIASMFSPRLPTSSSARRNYCV